MTTYSKALAHLKSIANSAKHSQGEIIDTTNLRENELGAADSIEAMDAEMGDWALDADGIEQLDKNGYRNGNKYTAV